MGWRCFSRSPACSEAFSWTGWLLFLTQFLRPFAYGSLSVTLVFYLGSFGLSESRTGLVLSLMLGGDVVISLFLTTRADRIGRRMLGGSASSKRRH